MKKNKEIKKISLHNLNESELEKNEQNLLKGGSFTCWCFCSCSCLYAGNDASSGYYGGSSTADNDAANDQALDVLPMIN